MRYFLLIVGFLLAFSSYGQNLLVKYSEGFITSEQRLKELPEAIRSERVKKKFYNLTVDVKHGISYYGNDENTKNTNYSTENKSETQQDDHIQITNTKIIVDIKNTEKFYYKDFGNNEMIFEYFNADQLFHGKDFLQNWNWQITDEIKVINGYTCKKALADWVEHDAQFTAWFTEDIPVNAGPEKFDGLPGLILYVGTPYYEYSAISIKEVKNKVEILKPDFKNKKTFTHKEITEIIKQKINNLRSSSITTQEGDKTITTETIIYKN
ncbi:GLPGLI family protein [Flavobacterium haoranii]|uniref:GLPGLI family protein n=1 Tax=Flavobacterium haoranii TaxID=683124 RepID=A0A1M6DSQ6_9FLAO|nr:GLPGLI family protein [Flavobacterium haoranii]SHI76048.1 GLPGLI family protein [Flavobacterium haoranii]